MGPCDWQLTMSVVFVYKNGNILLLLLQALNYENVGRMASY